jgi:predicted RNA-binding protein YlqC (UPF0109 family)
MKQLVEAIAKALVDNPDHVQVHAIEGEQVTVLELRVNASDVGKVIGHQGHGLGYSLDPGRGGHEAAKALHTRNP